MRSPFILDKRNVRRSFADAAGSYDAQADLQRQVAHRLLANLPMLSANGLAVDIGCGTGYFTEQLLVKFAFRQLFALDIAEPMLIEAQARLQGRNVGFLCADAEKIPFAAASVDALFSNLALQWCLDLTAVFADWRRVLKPGGRIAFSTFGPETLSELKAAWAEVDDFVHVNEFYQPELLEEVLRQVGMQEIKWQSVTLQLCYPSVLALMVELKGIGAHNVAGGRNRGLTTGAKLKAMMNAYPVGADNNVMASYQILFFTAVV